MKKRWRVVCIAEQKERRAAAFARRRNSPSFVAQARLRRRIDGCLERMGRRAELLRSVVVAAWPDTRRERQR